MPYAPVSGSTYVDFTGYGITSQATAELAYDIRDPRLFNGNTDRGINVALVLERNQDPTALLTSDWASRQQTLEQLNSTNSLWTTYGANPTLYKTVTDALKSSTYDRGARQFQQQLCGSRNRAPSGSRSRQSRLQKPFQTSVFFSGKQGASIMERPAVDAHRGRRACTDTSQSPPASNRRPVSRCAAPHECRAPATRPILLSSVSRRRSRCSRLPLMGNR